MASIPYIKARADHGENGPVIIADSGDGAKSLVKFSTAGINLDALGAQFQKRGKVIRKILEQIAGVDRLPERHARAVRSRIRSLIYECARH